MADFINTLDALGDDVVMNSIIDRTITEYKDDAVTKIGKYAFYGCTALSVVDVPNVEYVGDNAFYNCPITSFSFENVTTLGGGAFTFGQLVSVALPKITDLGYDVFRSCTPLTMADMPIVKRIYNSAFRYTNLTTLLLRADTVVTLNNTGTFGGTPLASGTGYIYVPRALVDSYKTATNWSTYAAQFRALEDYTVDGTTTGELDESKI